MTRENAILCLKGIKNYGRDTFTEQSDWQESLDMAIKALEQEPKIGHWMGDSAGYKCDRCGHDLLEIAHSIDYIDFVKPKYCPNCGCRMVEPQESEIDNG